jgi:hypothetical protein
MAIFVLRLRWSNLLGFHKQQHDSPDERERPDNRRDKVAVGGLNVDAGKIDRLSRGRKGDARVSEHHKAQSDQNDGNYRFCVHIIFLSACFDHCGTARFCARQQQSVSAIIGSLPQH